MLATAIALLLVTGPGDFTLTRAEITSLNELRQSTDSNTRNTIDRVALREGKPVPQAKIPAKDLDFANKWLDIVVRPTARPALNARSWVGNWTKDYENEVIDLKWQLQGQPVLWADLEHMMTVMIRLDAGQPLMRSTEDVNETLPELMRKLFNLPESASKIVFATTKKELPSGGQALTGYGKVVLEGVEGPLPPEQNWMTYIQLIVADRLVILRFVRPYGEMGGQAAGAYAPRKYSRFNPPN